MYIFNRRGIQLLHLTLFSFQWCKILNLGGEGKYPHSTPFTFLILCTVFAKLGGTWDKEYFLSYVSWSSGPLRLLRLPFSHLEIMMPTPSTLNTLKLMSHFHSKYHFNEKSLQADALNLNQLPSLSNIVSLHPWVFPWDDLLCIKFHFNVKFY